MKIPYRLRRRTAIDEAEALFLEGQDTGALLRLCERLDGGAWPRIHAVASGFLVRPSAPPPRFCPGAIRLQSLAENLFLPSDADLLPALLNDEAEGLTRHRGLIFLPGGRVLAFDPERPLPPAAFLSLDLVSSGPWGPLPQRPPRADRIREILLDPGIEAAEDLLDAGGQGIGTEPPVPEEPRGPSKVLGNAAFGASKGMMWLGQTTGLKGLSELGARWMRSALEIAPRLGEAVLGKQEAALRNLLREFREGNVETALRRALPLGGGTERCARVHTGVDLPSGDFRYSLGSLLGDGGSGARYWFGGLDVQEELAREYHKAAEAATRQGDFRRAAFIYGRLLQDYALAAGALMRGGLAHDAAILYLEKLNDPMAAARAFEAAGEVDRALRIYRNRREHVRAGDLLTRLDEPEAALEEYLLAAEQLAEAPGGHLRAGELVLVKARNPERARGYFAEGWAQRPGANAVPCAVQLARIDVGSGGNTRLLDLLAEAEAHFKPPGQDREAALLFNEIARLADEPDQAEIREDLRDRALMGLAAKLRQQAMAAPLPKGTVATLLGTPWRSNLALLRDAEFAAEAPIARPRVPASTTIRTVPESSRTQIAAGTVTAFAFATETEELFLGFQGGEVYRFRPASATVDQVAVYPIAVSSLAVNPKAQALAVLWGGESPRRVLAAYERRTDGSFRMTEGRSESGRGRPWLSPIASWDGEPQLGYCDGVRLQLLRGSALLPTRSLLVTDMESEPSWSSALLLPGFMEPMGLFAIAFDDDGRWFWGDSEVDSTTFRTVGWAPRTPRGSPLVCPPFSWISPAPGRLEVAGVGPGANLYRSVLESRDSNLVVVTTNLSAADEIYLATTLLRPGLLAGVTARAIHWLRGVSNRFSLLSTTEIAIPSAVACVPSRRTDELIVVRRDGWIERIGLPNH
ncbi:hypothetical protein BH23PLA1_BH23PLA1_18910 [soil metagenome]